MASAAPPIKERRPAAAEAPLQLKPVAADAAAKRPAVTASLSAGVQAKSFVSSPGDAAEREADRVAKHVMTMPAPAIAARGSRSAQRAAAAPAPGLPRAASPTGTDSALAAKVRAAASGGAPLSRKTRAFLEPRFRADFSGVMIHQDAGAARLATELGARAFTYGRHIFFAAGQYDPDSREGLELLAHELTHTIQQSETIQRKEADAAEAPRVAERTGHQASRLGISDVLDFFADAANAIPGYRMFTILIGVNPINMSAVEASAANILRAVVEFLPGGNIITRVLDSYGIFDKVGGWIEGQLKSLGITGAAIRAAIDRFLDSLGWRDVFSLGSVWNRAKAIFTDPINRIIVFARGLFAKILEMVQEAVLKPLAALAARTPFYTLLKAVLGKDPVTGETFEGGAAEIIGGFMTMIGQQELWQNIQRANAIPRAFAWFKTAMKGLTGLVSSIPTRFLDGLRSLEIMDFVVLPRAFAKIGAVFGSFLADFGGWALGTVVNLLKIIVEVVAPAVLPYIAKAAGAFNTILRNPIGFVGNLVKAAMQGFRQFASNFLKHLQASLVGWLTGAMAGANIYIPQGLSLREILKFVLSILGLTWANIRAKLVRATNETTVVALETGFDIVRTLVTEGPAAAWQKIIEVIGNLKQMAIDAIMDFVKSRVVQAAVTRLLSMLSPAGAFIQAIIAIYNTIMFFVERLRQIAAVAASFIDSIAAIASGSLGAAANRVETTMAGLLTLVISFLARIAGLGRVSDAVTNLINRIRAPIDRALDAVVNWIVTQARRLGRFILQAGTPADPNARLRLASTAAVAVARRLRGRVTAPILNAALAAIRTRYGLTGIVPFERSGRWFVRASINPELITDLTVPTGTGGPILGADGRPINPANVEPSRDRGPIEGPNMVPILDKLRQVFDMFSLWSRLGTAPVATQMMNLVRTTLSEAERLAADQDNRVTPLSGRFTALGQRLRAIQALDPQYELVSIGQMEITLRSARRQMPQYVLDYDMARAFPTTHPQYAQMRAETSRQLAEQQSGVNAMVVAEWLSRRPLPGINLVRPPAEATMRATYGDRSRIAGTGQAAPHNPDQVLAGYIDPTGSPANSQVNASLGRQNRDNARLLQTHLETTISGPARVVTQINVRLNLR